MIHTEILDDDWECRCEARRALRESTAVQGALIFFGFERRVRIGSRTKAWLLKENIFLFDLFEFLQDPSRPGRRGVVYAERSLFWNIPLTQKYHLWFHENKSGRDVTREVTPFFGMS